jgi:hypothetical protein
MDHTASKQSNSKPPGCEESTLWLEAHDLEARKARNCGTLLTKREELNHGKQTAGSDVADGSPLVALSSRSS